MMLDENLGDFYFFGVLVPHSLLMNQASRTDCVINKRTSEVNLQMFMQ